MDEPPKILSGTSVKDISILSALIGKKCLYGESRQFYLVEVLSMTQEDKFIRCYFKIISSNYYTTYNKTFKKFEEGRPKQNDLIDVGIDITGLGCVTLHGNVEEECVLAFRFGYFTVRLFFIPEFIDEFTNEEVNWFDNMICKFII